MKGHDYTISTLDVLQAYDACADMGMTYSVTVQCTDCVNRLSPESTVRGPSLEHSVPGSAWEEQISR